MSYTKTLPYCLRQPTYPEGVVVKVDVEIQRHFLQAVLFGDGNGFSHRIRCLLGCAQTDKACSKR